MLYTLDLYNKNHVKNKGLCIKKKKKRRRDRKKEKNREKKLVDYMSQAP